MASGKSFLNVAFVYADMPGFRLSIGREKMPAVKEFLELLKKMEEVHILKNGDYTSNGGFENFERAAVIASWFQRNEDKVFATLIGVKLARLGALLVDGRKPNNESIHDTHLDLTNYSGLWAANNKIKLIE